jgi:hypothetical protein
MTREGEINIKSSAPGDSRGPWTFFTPLYQEIYDRSFAYIVIVYGMANMNQREKWRVGR